MYTKMNVSTLELFPKMASIRAQNLPTAMVSEADHDDEEWIHADKSSNSLQLNALKFPSLYNSHRDSIPQEHRYTLLEDRQKAA